MFDRAQPTYLSLRNYVRGTAPRLLIWTGAGMSAAMGLPTWPALIAKLVARLEGDLRAGLVLNIDEARAAITFASSHQQLWLAMESLQTVVGDVKFAQWIEQTLTVDPSRSIPSPLVRLWKLRPSGVITTNLDRLITDAYPLARPGKRLPTEFTGRSAGGHIHALSDPNPWIAHIHGLLSDRNTWVLTQTQLTQLWETPAYVRFVEQAFVATRGLFLGIGADDLAIGGHLLRLRRLGLDLGQHYWVTCRTDTPAVEFANKAGLQIVLYEPDKHHRGLSECIADLEQYVPSEVVAPPVSPPIGTGVTETIPEPDDLDYRSPDLLRQQLNREAAQILAPGNAEAYSTYERFRSKYKRAIHSAWFLSVDEPDNRILSHRVERHIARGAFGDVYEGTDPLGRRVAIKIFREDQSRGELRVALGWQDTGSMDRVGMPDWLATRADEVQSALDASGWQRTKVNLGKGEFAVSSTLPCKKARLELKHQADTLRTCIDRLGKR